MEQEAGGVDGGLFGTEIHLRCDLSPQNFYMLFQQVTDDVPADVGLAPAQRRLGRVGLTGEGVVQA